MVDILYLTLPNVDIFKTERCAVKKTIAEVVLALPQHIRKKYDFSRAVYRGALHRIENCVCPEHGVFSQYSGALRKGITCPACGDDRRQEKRRLSQSEFVRRSREKHNGRYLYPRTAYKSMYVPVTVTCRAHGDFEVLPVRHLFRGKGCVHPDCDGRRDPSRRKSNHAKAGRNRTRNYLSSLPEKLEKVHGGKYVYDFSKFKGARKTMAILCPAHGEFEQVVSHHLRGNGCPQCSHHQSKGEDEVLRFLSVFTKTKSRDRKTIAPKELDILLPSHNLAIEYCGEFWHSHFNPGDERAGKHRHADKHKACAEKGIRLITVFESEWRSRKAVIKRLLRHAIGRSRGKLMARKCQLEKVSTAEAKAFYDRYHPQGGAGSGEHYALRYSGKLVACMRFSLGNNDRGRHAKNRVWTLSRYATRLPVAGAASRLFKAFLKDCQPEVVKSFSDNRFFAGGMYEALGFRLEAEVIPDYVVWSPALGLRPKSHYQRRNLPARQRDHGKPVDFDPKTDDRTEAEVTYTMGCGRLYDCGKKRWVWTP